MNSKLLAAVLQDYYIHMKLKNAFNCNCPQILQFIIIIFFIITIDNKVII